MLAAPHTIDQALESIRGEFPDISVSKVGYLENEGPALSERDRPFGHQRFRPADMEWLLFVSRVQHDRYLPLKVTHKELTVMDRGEVPSGVMDVATSTTSQNAEPSRRQPR